MTMRPRDIIEKAIHASAKTAAQLARDAGLSEATLSRFSSEKRDLYLDSAAALANALDLELVIQPKRRRTRRTGKRTT